jgi:hypothetical protein
VPIVTASLLGLDGQPELRLDAYSVGLVNAGERTLYAYGFITYRDAYSIIGDRITGYCYVYTPDNPPHFDNCKERAYTYAR